MNDNGNSAVSSEPQLVWYFSYGSNMNPAVFEEKRGIKCLDHRVCYAPGYVLTFGEGVIPYFEPAFCTCVQRGELPDISISISSKHGNKRKRRRPDIHGVAFLITKHQYEHMLVTEGGWGYQEYRDHPVWGVGAYGVAEIECVTIESMVVVGDESGDAPNNGDDAVVSTPATTAITATTSPPTTTITFRALTLVGLLGSRNRYDCNASQRYCDLVTVGAELSGLPQFYKDYLRDAHPPYSLCDAAAAEQEQQQQQQQQQSWGIAFAKALFLLLNIPCIFAELASSQLCIAWNNRRRRRRPEAAIRSSSSNGSNSNERVHRRDTTSTTTSTTTTSTTTTTLRFFDEGGQVCRPPWIVVKACYLYRRYILGGVLPTILFDWCRIPCGFRNNHHHHDDDDDDDDHVWAQQQQQHDGEQHQQRKIAAAADDQQ